jgi:hypothetical protein
MSINLSTARRVPAKATGKPTEVIPSQPTI